MKNKILMNVFIIMCFILIHSHLIYSGTYKNMMIRDEIELSVKLANQPVVFNNILYYALQYKLYAVDIISGKPLWITEYDDNFCTSPVVYNDSVLIGAANYKLCSFSAKDGKLKWEVETGGVVNSLPLVVNENVYFLGFDGKVYKVDFETGKLQWKTEIDKRGFDRNITPSLIFDINTLYGVTYSGKFFAVDYNTGVIYWIKELECNIESSPIIKEDKIYICTHTGELIELFKANGEILRRKKITGAKIRTTPVIYQNLLIVPSYDANIYGINLETFDIAWEYAIKNNPGYNKLALLENLLVADTAEKIVILDPNEGKEKFSIFYKFKHKKINMPVYNFPYLTYWVDNYIYVYELTE